MPGSGDEVKDLEKGELPCGSKERAAEHLVCRAKALRQVWGEGRGGAGPFTIKSASESSGLAADFQFQYLLHWKFLFYYFITVWFNFITVTVFLNIAVSTLNFQK